MALATKVEVEDGVDRRIEEVLRVIINQVLSEQDFF